MAEAIKYKLIPLISELDYERFWGKVVLTANSDRCWEWVGGIEADGYGTISLSGKDYKAHRVAYKSFYGIDPKENLVCHSCDNRKCVNPKHLFLGSKQDNADDMVRKMRQGLRGSINTPKNPKKGVECHAAKLTEQKVIEMRKVFSSGGISYKKLGALYDVDISVARRIILKEQWKHI